MSPERLPTIREVRIRNFKSFRSLNLPLLPGITGITGPNGSGKSNLLESIAFVLGHRGRGLRAARLGNLVSRGARRAEVTLKIATRSGERTVSRGIRGSTGFYRIGGRIVPRYRAELLLRELGYRADWYTYVAQGTVTRLVEMSPRERVGIVEEISGVREFERRRAEILTRLGEVEGRLEVIRARLSERERFLSSLARRIELMRRREELERRALSLRKAVLLEELNRVRGRISELRLGLEGGGEAGGDSNPDVEMEAVEAAIREAERRLRELESDEHMRIAREAESVRLRIRSKRRELSAVEREIEAIRATLSSVGELGVPREISGVEGVLGTVSQLIKPLPGYERAYRAAAGGRAGDVVVESLDLALSLRGALRRSGRRVRLIPLDVVRPGRPPSPPGYSLGLMIEHLSYDPDLDGVARAVFGGTVVVRDLRDVSRGDIGRARFVSLDGDLMERDGSVIVTPDRSGVRGRLERLDELEAERERLRSELADLERRVSSLPDESSVRRMAEELRGVRSSLSRLRERKERILRLRLEEARRRAAVSEELGRLEAREEQILRELDSLGDVEPADPGWGDPSSALAAVRAELRSLPAPDPGLEEEYGRELEKVKLARAEAEEIERERMEVLEALRRATGERDGALADAVGRLAEAFSKIYGEVSGGSARMWLSGSWPDAALEIEVIPPGKPPTRLESLSGGEKSVAALALVAAVAAVRPSPIYLFDEADAMLDAENCRRFAKILRILAYSGSQVLVVSLKRETLSEADRILGVTDSGGRSRVVGVDLSRYPG